MKWIGAMIGGLAGLFTGIVTLVRAYTEAPSMPGPFEMLIQLAIVAFLAGTFGIGGFIVGCLIDLCRRKNRDRP